MNQFRITANSLLRRQVARGGICRIPTRTHFNSLKPQYSGWLHWFKKTMDHGAEVIVLVGYSVMASV